MPLWHTDKLPYSIVEYRQHGGAAAPRPKKYDTDEERREGARQSQRKYFNANREAIYARRAKRAKRKQAAIKAMQKEPSART